MKATTTLLKHLAGEPQGHFPVWLMRQAGRYLPSYRAIRAQHSFWEMAETPEIAARVSLLPLEVIDVDAVIFFSDILTLPYGLGLDIPMVEAVGPVITQPLRELKAFEVFKTFRPELHTKFVGDALRIIKSSLPPEKTLIGFAGAPWTVGCYLIEGRGKQGFTAVTDWLARSENTLTASLALLAEATIQYLLFQIESGAQIVQLFDTWLPDMPVEYFEKQYVPMLNHIIDSVKERGVPFIYFAKGIGPYLDHFDKLHADVISVDDSLDLEEVDRKLGGKFSLQGNLDPKLLLGDEARVRNETRKLVDKARRLKRPPILNLGHGVTPQASVENVRAFVDEARTLWV